MTNLTIKKDAVNYVESEIDLILSQRPITILPNIDALIEYIYLNYTDIINSLDISKSSKLTYYNDSKEFIRFICTNSFNIDVFRNYKTYLISCEDKSDSWKRSKLFAAKAILTNLHFHRRVLIEDLTKGVKNIKCTSKHKYGVDNDEFSDIKEYINGIQEPFKKARLNAMFTLMSRQGLRQFEMLNIKFTDINFYDKTIWVKGKNGVLEDVKMHPLTIDALNEYIDLIEVKNTYLFFSLKGRTKGKKLTERGFRKIFDYVFDTLGIDRTAHGLRHFFVTTLLEKTNGNIGIVKQFSRHLSDQSVSLYDDRRLKKEHFEMFNSAFE